MPRAWHATKSSVARLDILLSPHLRHVHSREKIHSWRAWEDLARMNCHGVPTENNREKTLRRQTTFARHHTSSPSVKNSFLIWVTCFFRQFGPSVARTDYLTLRKGFIMAIHLLGLSKEKMDQLNACVFNALQCSTVGICCCSHAV
ncbi:hypothetical protein D5086_021959 [Populus alba]|uniref:Uncharacterized protein n=1 Tax=Populus alba TaxID=43335 RepID=A0ACC4BE60_POPAL